MREITLGILVCLLVTAAIFDIRYRRLPNWLCALATVAGLALLVTSSDSFDQIGSSLIHMAISLVIGMLLFRASVIGGGDGKFYASVAAGIPLSLAFKLLLSVTIAGLASVCLWYVGRRIIGRKISQGVEGDYAKFPVGTAISLGGLACHFL